MPYEKEIKGIMGSRTTGQRRMQGQYKYGC